MAVPAVITDLLVAAADNVPKGSDSVTTSTGPDEFFRAHAAIVRRLHAKGANVASAATVDLGAINDGSYVNITGTTTITSFGTIAAGVERTLLFAGALTLTHDAAKIILPGGVNIVTAAGDVFVFVSEGAGLWRCKTYQLATGGPLNNTVITAKIADGAVTTAKIADGAVTTVKVADDAVTYAKIQDVTATDRLLGRATAGAGDVEEIVCTPFSRTLLDDADAATARATLGVLAASDTTAGLVELATNAETQTGTDTARAITPANLANSMLSGVGQAWAVQTRALSTTYTNSTGRPIQLNAYISLGQNVAITVTVAGVVMDGLVNNNASPVVMPVNVVVPNGATYSIQASAGSPTIRNWYELR